MLALYHLFGPEKPLGRVPDGEKVIRESSFSEMPVANRSVLVGTDLDGCMHLCTVRTNNTLKVRFSAKLGEEPEIEVGLL